MKKLFIALLSLSTLLAGAHPTPPPAASTNDVNTGTDGFKYISSKLMKHYVGTAVGAAGGATNGIQMLNGTGTNTWLGQPTLYQGTLNGTRHSPTNHYGFTNMWLMDEWGGAADADATLQTIYGKINASGGSDLGGSVIFSPKTTYAFDATAALISGASSGLPTAQFGYGNYRLLGDSTSRLLGTMDTNMVLISGNNFRHVLVEGLNLQGSNGGMTNNVTHVGLAWVGASGQARATDLKLVSWGVGMLLNDVTGFYGVNLIAISNFIGVATAYKPDDVNLYIRADRNQYGFVANFTNGQATTYSDDGGPLVAGTFGLNSRAGILIGRGPATIANAYFENNRVAIQIGWNTNVAWEASYATTAGGPPVVSVLGFMANGVNNIEVWRQATVTFDQTRNFASSMVTLSNNWADTSTIESDRALVVVNSSGTSFTIGDGWKYVSGVRVPTSKISLTNDVAWGGGVADAAANKIVGWDNTDNQLKYWTLGTGLSYDAATDTISSSGGSGSPAGSDTQVQFNDGGSFGGDSGLLFNKTSDVLTAVGGLKLGLTAGGGDAGYLYYADGTTKALEMDQSLGSGITVRDEAGVVTLHGSVASRRLVDKDNVDVLTFTDDTTAAFNVDVRVPDEAYDATAWNGSLEVPTKNAIRDAVEAHGIDDVLTRGSDASGQSATNFNSVSTTNLTVYGTTTLTTLGINSGYLNVTNFFVTGITYNTNTSPHGAVIPDATIPNSHFVTNQPFTITGFTNILTGYAYQPGITVSNSSSSNITVTLTTTRLAQYSTNVIPSGYEMMFGWDIRASIRTNCATIIFP